MNIYGLQKLTLLDYPGHTACTVFTPACNFNCPYCHNSELISTNEARYSKEEFFKFLESRKGILDGVAITGGEPTIQEDLFRFVYKIKEMGFKVKLDTNGTNPFALECLFHDNLIDCVAMDIKNTFDKYELSINVAFTPLKRHLIERSIDLIRSKAPDFEFRTTVIDELHDPEDFAIIGEMIGKDSKYFLQSFVMSDNVRDKSLNAPSIDKLRKCAEIARTKVDFVQIRGEF